MSWLNADLIGYIAPSRHVLFRIPYKEMHGLIVLFIGESTTIRTSNTHT